MTAPHETCAAEVVLPCATLDDTLEFFTNRLGFRVETIYPADDPVIATISGHGVRLRLVRGGDGDPGTLRLKCDDPSTFAGGELELRAPNGTRVEIIAARPTLEIPPEQPSFVLERLDADAPWVVGRAGMRYRDLIPGRQGGRFIASHIHIPDGGPVPDYVHFHNIRFQMIYCYKGWVTVAYEDQGPVLTMQAGDCVLQPPLIRHRVLECSDGLEVIEVGCPAHHETHTDHEFQLPNETVQPGRRFHGMDGSDQRFVFHDSSVAEWLPWGDAGFESQETGIGDATNGLAGVRVVRARAGKVMAAAGRDMAEQRFDAEFLFRFVLEGHATLRVDGHKESVTTGDSFVVPRGARYAMTDCSELRMLEITLPAIPATGEA